MGKIEKPEPILYFDCGICGVTFDDKDEYDAHCLEDRSRHLEWGHAPCIYCHKIVTSPKSKPIFPFSKENETTPAVCDNCLMTIVKPALAARGALPEGETEQK